VKNTQQMNNEMSADGVRQSDLIQRLRRLLPYFAHLPGTWLLVILGVLISAITEPMIPALLKPLIDEGFQQGALDIWKIPASLLILFSVRGMASYLAQVGLTRLSNHGLLLIRKEIFNKLLFSEINLYSKNTSSSLSNSLVYESQTGSNLLISSFLSITRNSLTLIALSVYLFYLNWKLTLVVVFIFPGIAIIMRLLTRRLHNLTKISQNATDELAYIVEENVLAHREIRIHSAQEYELSRFERYGQELRRLAMKSTIAGAATTPLTQMLAAIALSIVISIALYQSSTNNLSVGEFAAFVTAMLMIISPIRQLSELSGPLTRALAALERGLDLLNSFPNEKGGIFICHDCKGNIQFINTSVQYSPLDAPAVKEFSLSINSGSMVAFVGPSGSGKTSLINVLPRFTDISSGQVLLDGVDIREWSIDSLRKQFAIVGQSVVLMNQSIAENVALGTCIDREKVTASLSAANLLQWVNELPLGMDTLVGHNAIKLSGGQRQRLAIARAIYKNAPILLLDEATSALDVESEKAIQLALQNLMQGRTTLVIAHRLSTVQHADLIVVLDSGKIVEKGSHLDLIAKKGTYASLYETYTK
jgi:subfamily B ATP-binding cassette protein MsbA